LGRRLLLRNSKGARSGEMVVGSGARVSVMKNTKLTDGVDYI
jgi:hypothetical protein